MYNNKPDFQCICQNTVSVSFDCLLKEFEKLREHCPAIKKILVPDDVWPRFKEVNEQVPDKAKHKSILLLALYRGYLNKITSPIHRFLLEGKNSSENLHNNYRSDLKEMWMEKETEIRRHQEARRFMGKLSELLYAEWLGKHEWKIENLEALGGDHDITAFNQNGEYAFEIKYFGQEGEEFENMLKADIGISIWNSSCYQPLNYIIFRILEATHQLREVKKRKRTIVLIFSETVGMKLDSYFKSSNINWLSPEFLENEDNWKKSLPTGKLSIEKLSNLTSNIHSIKIMKLESFEPIEKYSFDIEK